MLNYFSKTFVYSQTREILDERVNFREKDFNSTRVLRVKQKIVHIRQRLKISNSYVYSPEINLKSYLTWKKKFPVPKLEPQNCRR